MISIGRAFVSSKYDALWEPLLSDRNHVSIRAVIPLLLTLISLAISTEAAAKNCSANPPDMPEMYTLSSGYSIDAEPYVRPPLTAKIDPSNPNDPYIQYYNDIKVAISVAPGSFQKAFCQLSAMFVNLGANTPGIGSGDWGFWEAIDQRENPQKSLEARVARKYISIDARWWGDITKPTAQFAMRLAAHENVLNQNLLALMNSISAVKVSVTYVDDQMDDNGPTMALLSTLAHEMGHVLWYSTRFLDHDLCVVSQSTNINQTSGDFFTGSWLHIRKPERFHDADTETDLSSLHFGNSAPSMQQVILDANAQDLSSFYSDLLYIYTGATNGSAGGPANPNSGWVSFFSYTAPDEDFAETYKFYVLANAAASAGNAAPLTSLQVTIATSLTQKTTLSMTGFSSPYSAAAAQSVLYNKSACIQDFFKVSQSLFRP